MGDMAIPKKLAFGKEAKQEFLFDPNWRNLNHGSFGTIPKAIRARRRQIQDLYEARPDPFIRVTYPPLLDESRAALAALVQAPINDIVLVGNATIGVNTVYKNLTWNEDGKDTILSFSTIYGACGKIEDWVVDTQKGKVGLREMELDYPLEDDEIIAIFRDTVKALEAEGKRARICLFDVVTSSPGVRFPWEAMVAACKELGVLSLVDGAHSIGMIPLNLGAVQPDFFVTNCHKWLFAPRGCALFYVPSHNQHLIPSTLATSRGYEAVHRQRAEALPHADMPGTAFTSNFEFAGTLDDSPFICVKDAIEWRRDTFGGEEAIRTYLWDLNKKGAALVASLLSTNVLENRTGTLTNCSMANVRVPIWVGSKGDGAGAGDIVIPQEDAAAVFQWLEKVQVEEYLTFMAFFIRWGRFWVRLSAQVYLDMEDYEWTGKTIMEMCDRVGKGEYKTKSA